MLVLGHSSDWRSCDGTRTNPPESCAKSAAFSPLGEEVFLSAKCTRTGIPNERVDETSATVRIEMSAPHADHLCADGRVFEQ
jgi:hypothetical protein